MGAASLSPQLRRSLEKGLAEAEVLWRGDFAGLRPEIQPELTERFAAQGEAVWPLLLEALGEARTFVVAHVLLTRLTGVEHGVFPEYNGLRVELKADGSAVVDPEQAPSLARRWRSWSEQSPRPPVLPPVPH